MIQLLRGNDCCANENLGRRKYTLLPNLKQTDVVWRHVTEYAAESFHVLHMDSMSDDALLNQLLSPHLCQVMALFVLH